MYCLYQNLCKGCVLFPPIPESKHSKSPNKLQLPFQAQEAFASTQQRLPGGTIGLDTGFDYGRNHNQYLLQEIQSGFRYPHYVPNDRQPQPLPFPHCHQSGLQHQNRKNKPRFPDKNPPEYQLVMILQSVGCQRFGWSRHQQACI